MKLSTLLLPIALVGLSLNSFVALANSDSGTIPAEVPAPAGPSDPQLELLKGQLQQFQDDASKTMAAAEEVNRKMRQLAPGELIGAVLQNNLAMVETLVKNGANVNALDDRYNLTPLGAAASKGYLDIISLLKTSKADLNLGDKLGYTPLMTAILYNQREAVKMLVDFGSDLKRHNSLKQTALSVAKMKGYQDLVTILENAENVSNRNLKTQQKPDRAW